MRQIILSIFITLASLGAFAQPSPVKKAAKSMFKLTTFSADGNVLKTGYGVFASADGICLGAWEPFIGATSANVIDAQGRKYEVDCLLGANEIYNVAKFRVVTSTDKKRVIVPVAIAETQIAKGGQCWLVEYDVKSPAIKKYSPTEVETFAESLPYYIFEQSASEELAGSPFLNDAGELMGLMQPAKRRTDVYCPSAKYAMAMTQGGFTANEPTLRQSAIRVGLPEDQNQAVLALMMANNKFSTPAYLATAEEFIRMFPNLVDGYVAKTDYLSAQGMTAESEAAMNECYANCEQKAEAHFSFSKIIYNKVLNSDSTFTAWTFENALNEIKAAYDIDPLAIYTQHKAKILFSMKLFNEAFDAFYSLRETNMRSAESFYHASLCKQQMNAPVEETTAMLDSAVACFTKPYRQDAAPFLLIRGRWLDDIGLSRKAVNDFNDYEIIMKSSLNANFYYNREQIELRAKMYQTALNDIEQAIRMAPQEGLYYAEKTMLLVRVNHLDEAIETAKIAEALFPAYADLYAIHGLALIQKKKKADGAALLNKAKEMGSELADTFIEKYL